MNLLGEDNTYNICKVFMSINNNEYILQVYILILPYISQSLQFYERLIVIFVQSAIYFSLGPVDREWCAFSGWYGTISREI